MNVDPIYVISKKKNCLILDSNIMVIVNIIYSPIIIMDMGGHMGRPYSNHSPPLQ